MVHFFGHPVHPEDAREAVVVAYNREYKKKIRTSSNSK